MMVIWLGVEVCRGKWFYNIVREGYYVEVIFERMFGGWKGDSFVKIWKNGLEVEEVRVKG